MGAQMGKTDLELDLIGHRLDQRPAPILYVGPTREFVTDQFEPRVMTLLDEAPTLKAKVARGKRMKKTKKMVAGVPLRLAHGGSSSALKSDPAALALVDEYDEMLANIKGQGDPLGLVEARGFTYADFVTVVTSTPSKGLVETEKCPETGLEFWAVADPMDIESSIWKLWQEGTRFHWAVPCPCCGEYFIPRFKNLCWPKDASPARAAREAYIQCPQGCADPIVYDQLRDMNARGVYVAPGQSVSPDGVVTGPVPDSPTASFWVSGLCSPFVTWGERAQAYLLAYASGEPDKIQTAINAGFGECYALGGGDLPEWEEVAKLALPYRMGDVPEGVLFLTCGVDVQKNRLVYVVRGWGVRRESWLIASGELWGPTAEPEVWGDLDELIASQYGGLHIRLTIVDAGFRPGKKDLVPEHMVYAFARRNASRVFASKGYLTRVQPVSVNTIEVTATGEKAPYGLELVRVSTDFFKTWVHERLRWPDDRPGGWHLPEDVTEDYCRQIVSEARIRKPSGGVQWVVKSSHNHYLDCFDPETELLTEDGWMPVAEAVRYSGAFATVNLDTDRIEYQRSINAVARAHVGEMVEIKGRSIDLMVTPNHRLVTYRRNPIDAVPRITLAKDLTVWHTLKKTGVWGGRNFACIDLPRVHIPIARRGDVFEPARSVDAGDLFELLGWFVSEGHTIVRGNSRSIVITQNPGEKQDRILALIQRLGFRYRVTGGRQIVICSRQLFDLAADCYEPGDGRGCYRKRVPAIVREASSELIERFIDAAIMGDGWVQGGFRTYATTSKALADGMQELFVKIGRSANVRVRKAGPCNIRGGDSKNTVDQYHVSEIRTAQASLRRADNAPLFRTVPYSGMVYCVTVPNGTLIARRNGVACVVGNCEALSYVAAYMLGVHRISDNARRATGERPKAPRREPEQKQETSSGGPARRGGWLDGGRSKWL